jgi:hypothetical protein
MALVALQARATAEKSLDLVKKPSHANQCTYPAGENITAGAPIRQDGTTGRWVNAIATAAATLPTHLAWRTVLAGQSLTGVRGCWVDGYDLSALAYGAKVYASDTSGRVDTVAGTSSLVVGTVVGGWATLNGVAADKLLDVGTLGN